MKWTSLGLSGALLVGFACSSEFHNGAGNEEGGGDSAGSGTSGSGEAGDDGGASSDATGGRVSGAIGGSGGAPRLPAGGDSGTATAGQPDGGAQGSCQGATLDCDGSGQCAVDGSSDKNHCGTCDNVCFQQCRAGSCADPVQVSVGYSHACALLSDGSVWCWGSNFWGELGSNLPDGATAPVRVALPRKALAVQAGGTSQAEGNPLAVSCAVLEDKTARCWGSGVAGSLGNGLFADSTAPVEVVGVANIAQLALGGGQACAVTGNGKLYCWGLNEKGQVGTGTTNSVSTPVSVLTSVTQASCGDQHTCAVKSDGTLYCWGGSSNGKLGISPLPADTTAPLAVPGGDSTDEVSAGGVHTCARRHGDMTYCWGSDYSGAVNATFSTVAKPVAVDIDGSPPPAKRVLVGLNVSGVVGKDDLVTVWGSMFHGDGDSKTGYAPASLPVGKVTTIDLGKNSTVCAITTTHELKCWGTDAQGEVGNGDPVADVKTPALIQFN